MKIIICGAGRVGISIASYLSTQDNHITLVDKDSAILRRFSETHDVIGIVGHASQPDILKKAGADDADIIIAVTDSDETNMVACQIAHSIFGIQRKIARIRNKEYRNEAWSDLFSPNNMPIDVIISPEEEIADAILKRMGTPGTTNDIPLFYNALHMSGLIIDHDNAVIGSTIHDIYMEYRDKVFTIPCILRNGENIIPNDETVIEERDEIYILAKKHDLLPLLSDIGGKYSKQGNIIICGGGVIGEALIKRIEAHEAFDNSKIIIVENNLNRARELSRLFPDALVLNGSALDDEILKETNIKKSSMFVTVMNNNESNILSSILAKKMGCDYTIALSNNRLYNQLLPDRAIDAIVNPETITVSRVLHNLNKGHIQSVQSIRDSGIDVIEAQVTRNCGIINVPVEDIHLNKNIKILAVYRPETSEVIFVNDTTVIREDDIVVILSNNRKLSDIETLFSFNINLF